MNKYSDWFDNLPSHTQEWLKNQPVWHDRDIAMFFVGGMFFGFVIGLCF